MRLLPGLAFVVLGLHPPAALAQGASPTYPSPVARPNFVLIVLDDVGIEDLALVPTPVLDLYTTLARRYERFYVSPTCSPTRYMLQTGLYGHHDFVGSALATSSQTDIGLRTSRITIAEVLQAQGYQTAIFGKWHVNTEASMQTSEAPRLAGFQTWRAGIAGNISINESHYAWSRIDDGERTVETVYSTRAITDAALDWFQHDRDPQRPFFAQIAYHAPHAPFDDASPSGMLPLGYQTVPTDRGRFESAIVALDAAFAELATVLDLTNTYVVVVSDNGTPMSVPPPTGLEQGYKLTVWEGGIHVPMFVWGVDTVPGVDTSLTAAVDVPRTFLELTGVTTPNGFEDGISFARTRFGLPGVRDHVWCHRFGPNDGGPGPLDFDRWSVVRSDGMKLQVQSGVERLFDLSIDPHETTDLGATDPNYAADVAHLLSIRAAILTPAVWPY